MGWATAVSVAVLVVAGGVYALLLRSALNDRFTVELLPSTEFDPDPTPVLLAATQLARARRAVTLQPRAAAAVRVTLAGAGDGLLRYRMSVPGYARAVLRTALPAGVELVELGGGGDLATVPRFHPQWPPPKPATTPGPADLGGESSSEPTVLRAELTLARTDRDPLAARGLDPDPLDAFARVMAGVTGEDRVDVHLDLAPLTHSRERWWRRSAVARTESDQHRRDATADRRGQQAGIGGLLGAGGLSGGGGSSRTRRVGIVAEEMRVQTKSVSSKLFSTDPLWQLQVLIRVRANSRAAARAHLLNLLAAFEQFADRNYFKVCGHNIAGHWLDGADSWWRRRSFDQRVDRGLFRPRRTRRVRSWELLGLLKPPTAKCASAAVSRTPALPAAPADMPVYVSPAETPGLLPQGFAPTPTGQWVPIGTRAKESLFSLNLGRAEYGKSERAIVQAVHLANAGSSDAGRVGFLFLDPHADAIERMRPYLGAAARRILEINLSAGGDTQAGWNPLSMTGRHASEIEARAGAVVASFASAMSWGQVNNRALTLTGMAAQSLCELGLRLPDHLQPTIFQMTTILADEQWRTAVLPHLGTHARAFWETRFAKLSTDAITPVTNLLDRLRASDRVAALLGSPSSSYDVRRAMDNGQIVLVCPSGTGDKDRLVTALFLYDVLRAGLSRRDIAPAARRPFWIFADEITQYATRDLARMLEETRKFGLRLAAAAQSIERLPDYLREAFLTNRSHLITTACSADSARVVAREWGGVIPAEQITALDKYTALGSFRLNGKSTPPLFLYGFEVSDIYAELHDPDAPARISAAVDVTLARRPIAETLAALDTLDERILDHLLASRRRGAAPAATSPPGSDPSGIDSSVVPINRGTRRVRNG